MNTSMIRDPARGKVTGAMKWLTGLAALLLVFAVPIQAHAGTAAIDNSVQLDPFNPVPEIQFSRDGYCDSDCGGCRDRCGERRCCEHRCVHDCDRGWRDCDHDCRYNAWRCDRGCRDGWRDSYRDCDHDCRYGAWNCDHGCRDSRVGWRDCDRNCRYGTWECEHDCRNNWYGTGYRGCDRDCREGAWHCTHGCAQTYRELVRDYDIRGDRNDDQADRYDEQAHKYDEQSEWYKHHVIDRDHHADGHDGHDGYDRHDVHGELLPPADVFPLEPAHDGYGYDRRDAPRSGYEGPGPYDEPPPGDYGPPN